MTSNRYLGGKIMISKRPKIETVGLVKIPKKHTQFTININSEKYINDGSDSAVSFKYMTNREAHFVKNGQLNFTGGDVWECALSRLNMPNNFITFPSISAIDNLSAAYFVLKFIIKTKNKEGNTESVDVSQPYFLSHKKFIIPDMLDEIIYGLRSLLDYFCFVNNTGINITAELFFSCCFHLFIDPRSRFVTIKTLGFKKPDLNPFFLGFKHYFKSKVFLKHDVLQWDLSEIHLYFSIPLISKLGSFNFSDLEQSEAHSNIFKNEKLDRLIFIYKNVAEIQNKQFQSSTPYPINELSLMYFKTNIIYSSDDNNSEHNTIASIPIPLNRTDSIRYEPINLIWHTLKTLNVREISFVISDEFKKLLNYTSGNINFSLNFRAVK